MQLSKLEIKGFKSFADLKKSSVEELSRIPQIGKSLAKEIVEQISLPVVRKKTRRDLSIDVVVSAGHYAGTLIFPSVKNCAR